MRFECEKKDFTAALSAVEKALPARPVIAVTEGIKISAADGKIRLVATDMNLRIEAGFDGKVAASGEAVLNGRLLINLVKSLPDWPVTVETRSNGEIAIRSGLSEITLKELPVEDFPPAQAVHDNVSFTISSNLLRDVIRQTIFSVSTGMGREILTGELFKLEDGRLTVISLDGYRISKRQERIGQVTDKAVEAVIPGEALDELARVLPDDAAVSVKIGERYAAFTAGNTVLTTQLLSGQFFDCDSIINGSLKKAETTVVTKKDDLAGAIKRALLIVKEEKVSVVRFSIDNQRIVITAQTGTGKITDEIGITMKGQPLDIAFNGEFLEDCLNAIGDEQVTLKFGGSVDPCIIQPATNTDSRLYLVLPVKL